MKLKLLHEVASCKSSVMKAPRVAAVILFAFLGCRNVAGQSNPAQSGPVLSTPTQVETVSIYVTAGTHKGIPIRDLRPEDIAVTEDKAPAKIEKVTCGKPDPLLVGIVVDVSGSRRSDSHLLSHYGDLETFLYKLLAKDDGTYVVAYGDDVHMLSEVVTDTPGISAAFDKLRKLEPLGSTALYDGIKAASSQNYRARSSRRILIVIGDWKDNSSHVLDGEALRAAQRTATTIYAILDSDNGIESKKSYKRAVQAATEFAEQTGGLVYEVREKNDFEKVLQEIGTAVTGSCRVEYTTTENAMAKKGVKLHVEANSKNISILYPRVRFASSP